MMGAEDFSFMLNARPGAFIWIGNGDSAGLHHPTYNFNDEAIPFGTSYWVKLVETALPALAADATERSSPGFCAGTALRGFRQRARYAAAIGSSSRDACFERCANRRSH